MNLQKSEPFIVERDPFTALPRHERANRLDAYLAFLRERDGEPNLEARTLSSRERFFRAIDAAKVRWRGPLDRSAFHANLDRTPAADVDPKIVWLLAAAKGNRLEQYGVELDLELKGDGYATAAHGKHMTFIDLEEFYHTRILRDCCKVFDLDFDAHPPESFTRMFASFVVRSPFRARLVTALCAELFSCVAFQVLWESASVFVDEPEVMERMRLLVREILIDELGHVVYGHAMLGPAGLMAVRALFRPVAAYVLRDMPEFRILAGGTERFLDRMAAFDLASPPQLWGPARLEQGRGS